MRYEDYRLRDAAGEARVLASIPAKAFEHERHYLNPLPSHLPAPYQVHQRETDQYGYVVLSANYYWVPGRKRERVKVLEYADQMKIYPRRQCLAEYPLPPDGVKNASFSPEGEPKPRYQPKSRKRGSEQEKKRLRAMGPAVAAYVDYVLKTPARSDSLPNACSNTYWKASIAPKARMRGSFAASGPAFLIRWRWKRTPSHVNRNWIERRSCPFTTAWTTWKRIRTSSCWAPRAAARQAWPQVSCCTRLTRGTAPTLRLDRDRCRGQLLETAKRLRPRLLLLDPLVRLHGIDENHAGEVAELLAYIRSLQRQEAPTPYEPGTGCYLDDVDWEVASRQYEQRRPGRMDFKALALFRDGYRCRQCGIRVAPDTSEADHIKPVSSFASYAQATNLLNLQTLCLDCHKEKTYAT